MRRCEANAIAVRQAYYGGVGMKSKLALLVAAAALAASTSGAGAFPRVVTDLAAFRTGPGLTYVPTLAIPAGSVVDVIGYHNGWASVAHAGSIGFVARSLLARPVVARPVVARTVVTRRVVRTAIARPLIVGRSVAVVRPVATAAAVVQPVAVPLAPPPTGLITTPLPIGY
jgi:uncharacterized protein YraI